MKTSIHPARRTQRTGHRQRLVGLAVIAALQAGLDLATAGANSAAAATVPTYSMQLLGNLPAAAGATVVPEALGLNSLGQVSGRTTVIAGAQVQISATVWSTAGTPSELGRLPSNWSWASASAINDGGLAAGSVAADNTRYTAVRWSASGALEDLGQRAGALNSDALAINTVWQTAGWATQGNSQQAALWQADGSYVNLGHLSRVGNAGLSSMATGINDSGMVAGNTRFQTSDTQAWVWSPVSGMRALQQADAGASMDEPLSVSASGWVVGHSRPASGGASHAVAWDPTGRLLDIQGAGYDSSLARDINAAGWVVGDGGIGGDSRAWLWSADSGMVPLDTLIPGLSDFRLQHAAAINEFGQIAGWGYDVASGQSRAFLLSPAAAVPEPRSAALLAAGVLVLALRRRAA